MFCFKNQQPVEIGNENKKDKSEINLKEITESQSVEIRPTVIEKQQEMPKNNTPDSTSSLNLIIEHEKSNKINKKTKKIKVG